MDPDLLIGEIQDRTHYTFSRSAGAGGQNVNKVNTRVTARLKLDSLSSLNELQRTMLRRRLAGRVSAAGELIVHAQEHRSQLRNRESAARKITALVVHALARERPRGKTRIPKQARLLRLKAKHQRAVTKRRRGSVDSDE